MLVFNASPSKLSGCDVGKLKGKPTAIQTSQSTAKAKSNARGNFEGVKCFFACSSPRNIEPTSIATSHGGSMSVGGYPPVMLKRTSYRLSMARPAIAPLYNAAFRLDRNLHATKTKTAKNVITVDKRM